MNSQDFKAMYENSTATGYDAIVSEGNKSISDRFDGRAWMTYVEVREGMGYMSEKQSHEEAAKIVTKFHKGF